MPDVKVFPARLLAELQSVLSRVVITWERWENMDYILPVFGKHYQRGVDTDDVVWWRQFSKGTEPPTWEKVPIDFLNDGRFVLSEQFEGTPIKKFDLVYPATLNGSLPGCPCRNVDPEFEPNLIREAFRRRFDVEQAALAKMQEDREQANREAEQKAKEDLRPFVEASFSGPDPSRAVVPAGYQQSASGLLLPVN